MRFDRPQGDDQVELGQQTIEPQRSTPPGLAHLDQPRRIEGIVIVPFVLRRMLHADFGLDFSLGHGAMHPQGKQYLNIVPRYASTQQRVSHRTKETVYRRRSARIVRYQQHALAPQVARSQRQRANRIGQGRLAFGCRIGGGRRLGRQKGSQHAPGLGNGHAQRFATPGKFDHCFG